MLSVEQWREHRTESLDPRQLIVCPAAELQDDDDRRGLRGRGFVKVHLLRYAVVFNDEILCGESIDGVAISITDKSRDNHNVRFRAERRFLAILCHRDETHR